MKNYICLPVAGGPMTLEMKAKFFGMDVWFHQNGVANVLSLGVITDLFHVVFDSEVENAFMSKWQKRSCGSLSSSAADFTTLT